MIKKQELLQRLEKLEERVSEAIKNDNLHQERTDFTLRFLADKLGYEIKLKDVVKSEHDFWSPGWIKKTIVTEVEMVEKPKDYGISLFNDDGTSKLKSKLKK